MELAAMRNCVHEFAGGNEGLLDGPVAGQRPRAQSIIAELLGGDEKVPISMDIGYAGKGTMQARQ